MNRAELKELVRKVLFEESDEPEIIQSARRIVKNQQFEKVKDPVSGKRMALDMFSASAIAKVYDALSSIGSAIYSYFFLFILIQIMNISWANN